VTKRRGGGIGVQGAPRSRRGEKHLVFERERGKGSNRQEGNRVCSSEKDIAGPRDLVESGGEEVHFSGNVGGERSCSEKPTRQTLSRKKDTGGKRDLVAQKKGKESALRREE